MPRDPHEQGKQAPQEGTATGELTDIFASLRPVPTSSPETFTAPPAVQPAVESGGFTALFSTMNAPEKSAPIASPAPSLSEAPTEIFMALPHAPLQTSGPAATDQTVLFTPVSRAAPAPPAQAPASSPSSAGEFTQIFQPIAPPAAAIAASAMQTPVASVTPAPSSALSGEFTQFFSAISAREAAAVKPQVAPVAVPSAAGHPTETPAAFAPASAVAPQPGAFTQMFQQVQPPAGVSPSILPEPAAAAPLLQATPPAPETVPGAFTQVFSQLKPPSAPLASLMPVTPLKPPSAPLASPLPVTPPVQPSAPVFGAAAPRGSFTDVFAAQPAPAAAPGSPSAGFTELFRPAAPAFPTPPVLPPVPSAYGNVPATFAAPTGPPAAGAGAGEFTRLMQSLERSGPATPAAAPSTTDAAFFQPLSAGSAVESEYTRVLRGGGAAQGGFGATAQAPTAGSAAAPGLSLAPAAKDATVADKPAKEKNKPLVLLLVVMNVLLLLALIVIGILVLRHK